MGLPKITADFNNADEVGRVRLNVNGAVRDIKRLGIRLEDGLRVILHDDDLEADGEVFFSKEENIWVAKIDWNAIRRDVSHISRTA
jgi:hypothetical protein